MSEARKQTVLLVDGYSLIFRGFHALPLLTAPDGTYTNAVHGFFSMLIKALGEYEVELKPYANVSAQITVTVAAQA